MTTFVAFLRAINVGGHTVRMTELRAHCESIPLANVSTFIASGNVIFDSRKTRAQTEAAIEKKLESALGYAVAAMVRSREELAAIAARVINEGLDRDAQLYVGLLKSMPPAPLAKAVEAYSNDVDALSVRGTELYWRCATSLSQSTIVAAKLEKALGRPMTVRNFNTIRRLAEKLA